MWEAAGLQGNGTFPLDHFSYNNSALLEVIFRHVQATSFNGITVSEGGERETEGMRWRRGKKVRKSKREEGSSIKDLRGERNVEGNETKLGYLLVPSL